MYIFIPRISNSVTREQLHRFAQSILKKKIHIPLTKSPKIHSTEILNIQQEGGCSEHHGLSCIQPDSAAHWFIKQAQKHTLNKKPVTARKYFTRAKRIITNSDLERRRKNLLITRIRTTQLKFSKEGTEVFRREYGV